MVMIVIIIIIVIIITIIMVMMRAVAVFGGIVCWEVFWDDNEKLNRPSIAMRGPHLCVLRLGELDLELTACNGRCFFV